MVMSENHVPYLFLKSSVRPPQKVLLVPLCHQQWHPDLLHTDACLLHTGEQVESAEQDKNGRKGNRDKVSFESHKKNYQRGPTINE